jgi:hypothetical protein
MRLQTASGVLNFVRRLETESAGFYEGLARAFPQHGDVFLSFARENRRNLVQIERAYYSVITDAIEGCFAFDVETDRYAFDAVLPEGAAYVEALQRAREIEDKILGFYADAAAQSGVLMADVPRAFASVAKRREGRRAKLAALLEAVGTA